MTGFTLEHREISPEDYLRRAALEGDTEKVATEPGIYTIDGEPAIIYGRFTERYSRVVWAIKTINFLRHGSNSGKNLLTTRYDSDDGSGTKVFGFRPAIPLHAFAKCCSACGLSHSHPAQHRAICHFGELLANIYKDFAPNVFDKQCHALERIHSEWIIPGTPFTSGIVNQNNPLKYHYDKGNFEGVFSAMAVFKKDVAGGYLSIPQLNTRFLLDDHTFLLFDGQSLLHGVTPLKRLNTRSYRYSVVYYALKNMAKCGTIAEEISKARKQCTSVSRRRV